MATVTAISRTGRRPRRPQHPFYVEHRPFLLCPFMIAPVLPGETMKNLLLQDRVVSQPINAPLVGWWLEYYFFYVKLRDLTDRDKLTTMLIDPSFDHTTLANYNAAVNLPTFRGLAAVDYVGACMERVYDEFFINQDVDSPYASTAFIDGYPVVSINNQDFTDSLIADADYVRPDVDVDLNADSTITASEIDQALRNYQWLRSNGLTEVSYEDYLRTFGIRPPKDDPHIPELVRYVREWTYPTNTVDPSTGVPTSCVSWSIQERADKDRFFREPGFLFGVTTARPKVYMSKKKGLMAGYLNDALAWLPAVMRDDPITSMKRFLANAGPLDDVTEDYWIDVRDLFMYGEHFTNQSSSNIAANWVALPNADGTRRYPVAADINQLFVTGTANKIRHDGIVSLNILSAEQDYSATTQGALRATGAA